MLDPLAQYCWSHARVLHMVSKVFYVVSFSRSTAGTNIVGSCYIRLHTTVNTGATTPNIVGSQYMLGVVTSVCLPLLAQQCWELLCPFSRSSRIEGTSRTTDRAPTDCACSRSLVDINTVFQCTVGAVRSI